MDKKTYIAGEHNFICDICGFKYKSRDKRITWDNKVVCKYDYEPRHPQDFVRSRYDDQNVTDARPEPEKEYLCEGVYEPDVFDLQHYIYIECSEL